MNDPGHPQPPTDIPSVPPPPPKINTRRLWITLLAPSGVMVLFMIGMFIAVNSGIKRFVDELFFTLMCCAIGLSTAIAWGFFIHTIYQRFRGTSFVLLLLAYPILQAVLVFAIFFVGCLGIVATDGAL